MNDIEIRDKFKIDDSHSNIRGIVSLSEENGKIIFTNENMIVKEGRKMIMNRVFGNNTETLTFYLYLSDINEVTVPEMQMAENYPYKIKLSDKDIIMNENTLEITIIGTIEGNEKITVHSAGLFFNNGTEDKLFSRVVFPGTTIKANTTYKLTYHIYF